MADTDPAMPSGGPVRITDLGEITLEQLETVLRDCLTRLDDAGISYAIMGGLAVTTLSRPRWTHDIDIFLRPRDAARALKVLADAGYEIERYDHEWLFKAFRDDVTIDLIFQSSGNIYFDDEVERRRVQREFLGVSMPMVSPEDLLVIKSAADSELNHYHWFDALGLMVRQDLDWDYVLERSRSTQRHLLSLLVYADAADIDVPVDVIRELSARLYGGDRADDGAGSQRRGGRDRGDAIPTAAACVEEELRQRLRQHPDIGDLDIGVRLEGDTAVITGEVETGERRRQVEGRATDLLQGWDVRNDVTVRRLDTDPQVEVVS
jgi:hypothetical protein